MRRCRGKPDDRDVLNLAVIASLLTAVVVELRHRHLVAQTEGDTMPWHVRAMRTRFLVEVWAMSGVCLLLLAVSQPSLR
jgi:hypothetical protein